MPETVHEKVIRWSGSADTTVDYSELLERIDFFEEFLYSEYKPTRRAKLFRFRLGDWVNSVSTEKQQQTMLQFVPHLFFVGENEALTLFQTAFNGPITRWLIQIRQLNLDDNLLDEHVRQAIERTWFCSISDMDIGTFYRVNGIAGRDLRPDWRVLSELGSPERIANWIKEKGIEYIVLVEDFIGSGKQMRNALEFAAKTFPQIPILLCAIIICPNGVKTALWLKRKFNNVSFEKVLEVSGSSLLTRVQSADEPQLYQRVRQLVLDMHNKVRGKTAGKPKNPFGFDGTGSLVVLHSNCPNNAHPFIHAESHSWDALFPRVRR